MVEYLTHRLLYSLVALLLLTLTVFASVRLLPGNAVYAAIAESGFASQTQIDLLLKDLGLDEPFHIQYARWLGNAVRGDLGNSFVNRRPVSAQLRQALPVTLELGVLAIATSLVIALPLGVVAGLKRNSAIDFLSRLIAIIGITVPSFVVAMLVLLAGLRWFGWVPPTAWRPLTDDPASNLKQIVLPSLILGYALSASVTRMMRSTVLEVLHEDFVRTAHAKGLASRTVILRHVVRNSLIPVVTVIGVQVASVLGGAVVIESIFNLPGLGFLLLSAVTHRDFPVIQAGVLFVGVTVIVVNLAVDVAYGFLDPRIRFS